MNNPKNKAEKGHLKLIYIDIINGYSVCKTKDYGKLFIRHMNLETSGDIDKYKDDHLNKAKEQGLPTRSEKMSYLYEEELWSEKKEDELKDYEQLLDGLRTSKAKVFLQKQIDYFNKEINKIESKRNNLFMEKEQLFGFTAEAYADKKVNEYYVQHSLYKDKDLNEMFFSEEEFDSLNTEKLDELIFSYSSVTKWFNSLNYKRIALSTFFLNYFYLCDDNPNIFYGRPVVKLSYNQVELFGYARHYKNALQEMKTNPPDELYDDPEKLEEWVSAGKNADKVMEKNKQDREHGASSIVGATKEDLKRLGYTYEDNTDISKTNLSEKANSSKKQRLSFEDLIKIHEGKKVK